MKPAIDLEEIVVSFQKKVEQVTKDLDEPFIEKNTTANNSNFNNNTCKNFIKRNIKHLALIFCTVITSLWMFFFIKHYTYQNECKILVRSDFSIPNENVRLERSNIIKKIEEKLKIKNDISVIALVGIGGAGKTTIARQIARKQKTAVVWELNAETEDSLFTSYENLAVALSETDTQVKIIKEIKEIKNKDDKRDKLIKLLKEYLRQIPDWFLIFDNLDELYHIQKYFPLDSNNWGNGKIIITSRNNNIKNSDFVKNTVEIGELSSEEKLDLFIRIMPSDREALSPVQIKKIERFLQNIPSFPLDVSIASNYIKSTNISYETYNEHLNSYDESFSYLEENILKGVGNYRNTRNKIIIFSLEKIINENSNFAELLLLISLLDSQNISTKLLSQYKGNIFLESFIFCLKKYSLLSNESYNFAGSELSFSIHRSTHKILSSFFAKNLKSQESCKKLNEMVLILARYINEVVENEDTDQMKAMITHCEIFINHINLLTENQKNLIKTELGGIYYFLGDYVKAKQILEEIYFNNINDNILLPRLLVHLGILYRELGDYNKSKEFLEKSIRLYKNNSPEDYCGLGRAVGYLGIIYRELGEYEKSKIFLQESLIICKKLSSKNYIGIPRTMTWMGTVYSEMGDYQKARDLLEQSLSLYKTHFPKNYYRIAWTLAYLGTVYREMGDYQKAKEFLEQSLSIYKTHFSKNQIGFFWTLAHLGTVYSKMGDYQKARDLLEQSLAIYKSNFDESHVKIASILIYLGTVYKGLGLYEQSKNILEQALLIYEHFYGAVHIKTANVLHILGSVYFMLKNIEKSRTILNKSFVIFQQNGHSKTGFSITIPTFPVNESTGMATISPLYSEFLGFF